MSFPPPGMSSMPCTIPRREDKSPITVPAYSSGVSTSTDIVGSSKTGVALSMPKAKPVLLEPTMSRSEEHTSELQSRGQLVCRLLLEKKTVASHHNMIHVTSVQY